MIGSLVAGIFKMRTKSIVHRTLENPGLKNSFQKYIDNTEKFRQELKDIGYTSKEDLKKALAKNPRVKDYVEF